MQNVKIMTAGDSSILIQFGNSIDPDINARIAATVQLMKEQHIEGVVDIIPAFCSLLINYDPRVISYDEMKTRMEKIFKLIGKRGRTTVPFEIRMKMRIGYNSLVSYEMKDENTVILRKEKICDGCKHPDENEGSILDVVNSLTETEQKALHRYLSIKLSAKEHA